MFTAQKISGTRAKKLIKSGAILVDMRDAISYRDGTIPGAVNLPLIRYTELFKQPKTKNIILFGKTNQDKDVAAAINYLTQMGYPNVYDLGTIDNWEK